MIISVTMNPAVDKTLELTELKVGVLNRVKEQKLTAGGKGINVANDLISLGADTAIAGFVAEKNIDIISHCLTELEGRGVKTDFVKVSGRNRTNVKIIEESGRLTEINEPGFEVTPEDSNALIEKLLKYAKEGNSFVITGSVPKGVSKAIYRQLTDILKKNGAKVYIDADGELLKYAVEAKPSAIKPNELELLEFFGDKSFSEKTLIGRAKEIVNMGVETVIVSRGEKGSLFVTSEGVAKCGSIPIEAKSTVGAGDAMLAAFVYYSDAGIAKDDVIKYSVAASAYAAMQEAPFFKDKEEIEKLAEQVEMSWILY